MTNQERLLAIIAAVGERMQRVNLPELTAPGSELLEAAGAFLRGCYESAQGVAALAGANEYGGVIAVERMGWEMWRELEYLLRSAEPDKSAIKVKANAALELIGTLDPTDFSSQEMHLKTETLLLDLEKSYPSEVAEVRDQRSGKRFHWSGGSRSAVVASAGSLRDVYKMLSWHSHPDMCVLRDISTEVRDGRSWLVFHDEGDASRAIERACWATGEYLQRAWNLFAQALDQEEIAFPLPSAP